MVAAKKKVDPQQVLSYRVAGELGVEKRNRAMMTDLDVVRFVMDKVKVEIKGRAEQAMMCRHPKVPPFILMTTYCPDCGYRMTVPE